MLSDSGVSVDSVSVCQWRRQELSVRIGVQAQAVLHGDGDVDAMWTGVTVQ